MTDRQFAEDVVRRLRAAGFEALFAGGCVRDELLGVAPADYDVATSARPEQVTPLFRRTVEVGASFGVVEAIGPRRPDGSHPKVQIATFRSDGAYTDGRRPDAVTFSTAEEDAQRRDFTINGMFFDPLDGRVIDYVGGQADLRAKVLRAIGEPRDRFREDKLRLMRAVRMAARFGFWIEAATAAAVREMAAQLPVVSAERIADELRKMLVHPKRAWAVGQLADFGLLRHILPEAGTAPFPALAALAEPVSAPLAIATLLVAAGRRVAGKACRRLRLANVETDRVEWLVDRHAALADAETQRPSRLYPLLIHPGIAELLALHRAEAVAAGSPITPVEFCERVLRETPAEVLNPPPLLTGDDLIALGWPQGPLFKVVLDAVRAAQLDGTIRTREEAIRLAEEKRGDHESHE